MADIGLFGGTFDPVHHGHLQCAAAARAEAGIDRIVFIPSARPPHKNRDGICNFVHRLSMLEIVVKPFDYCSVSDLERERSYPSYTFDTWNIFRKNTPPSTKHFFIIGCDAFLEIKSWYRWQAVIARIDFIIVIRPGYNTSRLYQFLAQNGFTVEKQKFDHMVQPQWQQQYKASHYQNRRHFLLGYQEANQAEPAVETSCRKRCRCLYPRSFVVSLKDFCQFCFELFLNGYKMSYSE